MSPLRLVDVSKLRLFRRVGLVGKIDDVAAFGYCHIVGWIEEVPGVNTQGSSREELLKNLHSALTEALEMNREEAQQAAGDDFEEVRISA